MTTRREDGGRTVKTGTVIVPVLVNVVTKRGDAVVVGDRVLVSRPRAAGYDVCEIQAAVPTPPTEPEPEHAEDYDPLDADREADEIETSEVESPPGVACLAKKPNGAIVRLDYEGDEVVRVVRQSVSLPLAIVRLVDEQGLPDAAKALAAVLTELGVADVVAMKLEEERPVAEPPPKKKKPTKNIRGAT